MVYLATTWDATAYLLGKTHIQKLLPVMASSSETKSLRSSSVTTTPCDNVLLFTKGLFILQQNLFNSKESETETN